MTRFALRRVLKRLCVAAALLALAVPVLARDAATQPADATTQPSAAQAVDGKALLRKFVGEFVLTSRYRPGPNDAWIEMAGGETGTMTLNDRFVESVCFVKINNQTVWNVSIIGFDPKTSQFSTVSMADDEDIMMSGTGVASADGKGMVMTTADQKYRFEITPDDRGYGLKGYTKDDSGKEFQYCEERYNKKP